MTNEEYLEMCSKVDAILDLEKLSLIVSSDIRKSIDIAIKAIRESMRGKEE